MSFELPQRIGKYHILCELGQGGMAVLYLGRAVGPGGFLRLFAIKTIHEQFSREEAFVQMFLDEARLMARIHHPNTIGVYEVAVDRGRHYIAMEYVNGETLFTTLAAVLKSNPPFPVPLAIHLMEGVCEALHATHELTDANGESLGVVHRDISPQNIMIGYDGIPRLMDFGVAKAADQLSQTRAGTQKGKVPYMAPEQIDGRPLDRRVDIFALGVVLWEVLAGRRLFKRANDFLTVEQIRRGVVPKLDNFRSDVPQKLSRLLVRCLARDPERRPADARSIGQALHGIGVENGLVTSTSEVETFMRGLFEDRYAQRLEVVRRAMEQDTVEPTGLIGPPGHAFSPIPTVTGDLSAERSATHADPVAKEDASAGAFTTALPTSVSTRTIIIALIALAVVVGVTAVNVGMLLMEREQVRIEIAPPVAPPTAPSTPPAAAAAEEVRIAFDVVPRAAVIRVDGRRVVGELTAEKSDEPMTIEIVADGFIPVTKEIVPSRDQRLRISLEPVPNRRRPRPVRGQKRQLLLDGDEL